MIPAKTSGINFQLSSVLLLFTCMLTGCSRIPPEYRAFLALSPDQRHNEMMKLPIDKRIDYYLAGLRYAHPPQIGLADDIAQQGKQALPVLLNRLRAETDEMTQFNMMYIFKVMHASYYSLKDEKEVIAQLKHTADSMRDPSWKSRSEEVLRFIEEKQSPDIEKIVEDNNELQGRDY